MDVLRKPDLWGAIGTGLGQGIIKGAEGRQKEAQQERQEERQEKTLAEREKRQEGTLAEREKRQLELKDQYAEMQKERERSRLSSLIQEYQSKEGIKDLPRDEQARGLVDFFKEKGEWELANKAEELEIQKQRFAPKPPKPEKPAPLSPFEKKVAEHEAKKYTELQELIPQLQNTQETIDRLRDLSRGPLSGAKGYLKTFAGSPAASEFNTITVDLVRAPLKIINPVGAIPKYKIELIYDKMIPKPHETQRTIEGKLRGAEMLTKQALSRAQQRLQMIEAHNGKPPPELMTEYDKQTESLADIFGTWDPDTQTFKEPEAKTEKQPGKTAQKTFESMPDAKKVKQGSTLTGPDGKKYKSINGEWVPQ